MSQNPNHDLSTPFPTTSIVKAAETLLKRDRFDNDRLPSDSEESDAADGSSSEADSDTDDSGYESPVEVKRPLRKAAKKPKVLRKKKVAFKNHVDDDEDRSDAEFSEEAELSRRPRKSTFRREKSPVRPATPSRENDEVEDLIKQLGKLSIDDPAYAVLYFRAVTKNPLVKDIVPSPSMQRRSTTPTPTSSGSRFERQPPPHMAGAIASNRPERGKCWGCGEAGHTMFACPALADLEKKGVIKRDRQGRVYHSNGDSIQRQDFNKTILQAVNRATPPTSNFIGINDSWDWDLDAPLDTEEDTTVTLYNYLCDDSDEEAFMEAYPVERVTRSTNTARKERFDGVYVPPRRPALSEAKENRRPGPPGIRQLPSRFEQPVPVEVHPPQYNGKDDDIIMEDQTNLPGKVSAKSDPVSCNAGKDKAKEDVERDGARMARRSDVQAQVNPKAMLKKLLDTPITVGVGELLAVSKEMAQQVQEVIKPKPQFRPDGKQVRMVGVDESASVAPSNPNIVASATFTPRTRGQLIRVKFECDGVPISAIVDTGSQLNIAHKRIWQQALTRPMDVTRRITMNDANGGEGILHGFISDIPLTCGSVVTYANVYVGNQAPFDLLLGRPWQRGNYVSIDERKDGTYLLFKDKEFNVRFEMLATPERDLEPIIADYLARTAAAASSMFIQGAEPDVLDEFLEDNWMEAFGGVSPLDTIPELLELSMDSEARIEEIDEPSAPDQDLDLPESPSESPPESPSCGTRFEVIYSSISYPARCMVW